MTHDDPATRILRDWWDAKRGDRAMPLRAELDPCELKAILPHLVLLDVRPTPDGAGHDFAYRLAGTEIDARLGFSLTGLTLDQAPFGEARALIQRQYETVVREARPVFCTHNMIAGDRYVEYNRLAVPLGNAAGTIVALAAAVDFKCVYRTLFGRPPTCGGANECDRIELCAAAHPTA